MADQVPITLTEGNDEQIIATINRRYPAEDLLLVTAVEFYLKDSNCDPDTAALLLSSADPTQVVILTQTSAQITAKVFVPALHGSYQRFYRVDATGPAGRHTSTYGPVTVNNV